MILNVVYGFALVLASPWIAYRVIRHGRYRRGLREKLWGLAASRARQLNPQNQDVIWFHAVSVGEVKLLPAVVQQLQRRQPDTAIVVSASTDTGYDLAVDQFGAQRVFFCPLDFTWAVRRTLKNLQPRALVLAELELWPNLIRAASDSNCHVMVINARLSERSAAGYQRWARWTGGTFAQLRWVGCQSAEIAKRFNECGVDDARLAVTGSIKFDNAPSDRSTAQVQSLYNWAGIDAWHRVWCVGSTQEGEDEMALRIYQALRNEHPDLRLILVPRHVERFDAVAKAISAAGLRSVRRSENDCQYSDILESDEVVLVDTIGELADWWGVADIATVGGSFGDRGGQNMLEPAGYGCAISFGSDTRNFRQIADALIEAGGATRVDDEEALRAFIVRALEDPPWANALGRKASQFVNRHRGATEKTLAAIDTLTRSQTDNTKRAA